MAGSSSESASSSYQDHKRKRKSRKRSKSRSSKRLRMERMESKLEDLTNLVTSLIGMGHSTSDLEPNYGSLNSSSVPNDPKPLDKAGEQPDEHANGNDAVTVLQMGDEQSQNDTGLEVIILDDEVKKLLGDSVSGDGEMGPPFHPEIAKRWESIAKQGVLKEDRERIRKKFCPPPNCTIVAPALNPELKTVNGFTKARDEEMRRIQGNIATAITGLGQTLTSVLDDSKPLDRNELIALLSDTGRFLTGTQYQMSLFRRKEVKSTIREPSMLEILSSSQIYPDLFGAELTTKVKQATSLTKVGQDITKANEKSATRPAKFQPQRKTEGRQPFQQFKSSLNSNRPPHQTQFSKRGGRPFQRK